MKSGVYYHKGKTYVILTTSLIKKIIKHGNEIENCPKYIKEVVIDKKYNFSSASMDNGNYFESMCIGSTADKNVFTNVKRLKSGIKSADHKRIDLQVLEFRKDAEKLKLEIDKFTVQQQFVKVLKIIDDDNLVIILKGTLDLFSNVFYYNQLIKSVIDLKLTKNVNTTSGDFCWGTPDDMDHIQAYNYMLLTGLPFYYMLYDYKASRLEKKVLLKVNMKPVHYHETIETIRKAVANLIHFELTNWPERPGIIEDKGFGRSSNKCLTCPVKECKFNKVISEIN